MDYESFDGPDGQSDNPGGTAGFIYFAPKRYFDVGGITQPDAIGVATTLAELATNATDFTFLSGKGFHKLYTTFNTGDIEFGRQGELDGYSYAGKGKGFTPGILAAMLGFWRIAKNDRFVILVPTADAQYVQCGDSFFDAYLSATKTALATNSSGRRGSEFEIMVQASGMYLYTGAIVEFP